MSRAARASSNTKPMASNTKSSIKLPDIARLIRNVSPPPAVERLPSIIRRDVEYEIVHNEKNKLEYYDIEKEKDMAKRFVLQNPNLKFQSLHNLADSKGKKAFAQRFLFPSYGPFAKQVLKEIRNRNGRLSLLTDLQSAFDHDLHNQKIGKTHMENKGEDIAVVAMLDEWEKEKAAIKRKIYNKRKSTLTRDFEDLSDKEVSIEKDYKQSDNSPQLMEDYRMIRRMTIVMPESESSIPGSRSINAVGSSLSGLKKYKLDLEIPQEKWTLPLTREKREIFALPMRAAFLNPLRTPSRARSLKPKLNKSLREDEDEN